MSKTVLILILLSGSCLADVDLKCSPPVKTVGGYVQGTTLTSTSGREFYAFLGIRYAKPMLGDNRFADTDSVEPWNGIYNATDLHPSCLTYEEAKERGPSEADDCLFVNIYTQSLEARRPVIVFLPNVTGNVIGSSYVNPRTVMNQDVVFVTFSHRLEPKFDENATIFYAYNDRVVFHEWVTANIAAFGGDANTTRNYDEFGPLGGSSQLDTQSAPLTTELVFQSFSFKWTIRNFGLWRPASKYTETLIKSPYFYPRDELHLGKAWYLQLYPDGFRKDYRKFLSVFLTLDGRNSSPLQASAEIQILRSNGTVGYSKEVTTEEYSDMSDSGIARFISRKQLFKKHLLDDNDLHLMVHVTVFIKAINY